MSVIVKGMEMPVMCSYCKFREPFIDYAYCHLAEMDMEYEESDNCRHPNCPLVDSPEPHWIPVTEEPIPDGEYLVTWTSEIQEKPIISIVCRYSEVWDCWELQALGHQDIKILAYMPLPEPFKGVTDGND